LDEAYETGLAFRLLYDGPDAAYALKRRSAVGTLEEPFLRVDAISVDLFSWATAVWTMKFCVVAGLPPQVAVLPFELFNSFLPAADADHIPILLGECYTAELALTQNLSHRFTV